MPGIRASASGRQLESTVLGSYKAELREFRALQQELEPWTEAFREQHKCKPSLADVQATREPSRNPILTVGRIRLCWLHELVTLCIILAHAT